MLEKDDREYCIICGRKTGYRRFQPIDSRQYYIYGAGQLCQECYQQIYYKSK